VCLCQLYDGSTVNKTTRAQQLLRWATIWPQQTCGQNVARGEVYLPTKLHLDPSSRLATTDMGQKLGDAVPLSGGSGSLHNSVAWLRPTSIPSGSLIHPAVWPQQTWATSIPSGLLIHPNVWPVATIHQA